MTITVTLRANVVEAMRWVGPDPEDEVELFCGEAFNSWIPSRQQLEMIGKGRYLANPGDWILRFPWRDSYLNDGPRSERRVDVAVVPDPVFHRLYVPVGGDV